MNIQLFLSLYAISVPVFLVLDFLWLGLIAKPFYQNHLSSFLGPVNWTAAIVFYLLFIIGLTIFATLPAAEAGQWQTAAIYGALFGFFTYATYDLTNLATLKDWPFIVVIVDVIWGAVIGSAVATSAYYIKTLFS